MASLEPQALRGRARRAYEVGRLRAALRIALVLLPVSIVCWLESDARGACGCLAVLLLSAATFLRWRNRRGAEDVALGLLAGAAPVLAGLAIDRLGASCGGLLSACAFGAALVGAAAGLWLGLRARRRQARQLLTALAVATLLAGLGCLDLGAGGLVGVTLGLVGGAFAGWWGRRSQRAP